MFAYVLNGRNIQMGNIYTFNLETKNNKLTIRKYNIIRSARLVIIKLVVEYCYFIRLTVSEYFYKPATANGRSK